MADVKYTLSYKKNISGALNAFVGKDGKSAYEVAVVNGFEGTEQEWLNSLKGEKGDTGKSGVYVGAGDMPEDCNVQIDPTGDAFVGESFANALKVNKTGTQLTLDDVSLNKHNISCKVKVENLIPYPFATDFSVLRNAGLTVTDNGDGSFVLNGTVNAQSGYFDFVLAQNIQVNAGTTYYFSGCGEATVEGIYANNGEGAFIKNGSFVAKHTAPIAVYIPVYGGTLYNNVLVKPQLGTINVENVTVSVVKEGVTTQYTPNEYGTVSGITSAPSMTLLTDTDGAVIEVVYNQDTSQAVENAKAEIINEIADCNYVSGKRSANLFDKTAITEGYYLKPASGELAEHSNFCVSDFIPVEAGKTYSIITNSNSAFFDVNKQHLKAGGSDKTFTAPTNASYFRCSIGLATVDTFCMNEGDTLLPYEEYGKTYLTMDSFDDSLMTELKEALDEMQTPDEPEEVKLDVQYFEKLKKHLMNPFVKTQITLVGDSITEGVGGTGHSNEGEVVPGTTHKTNVLSATCWSNMLYRYIDEQYNKEFYVRVDNEGITYNCSPSFSKVDVLRGDIRLYFQRATIINNKVLDNAVQFSFYGDKCSIQYVKGKSYGIFNVFVDGTLYTTIDGYAETNINDSIFEITGLTESEHTVSIGLTNAKNELASHSHVSLTGFIIKKVAVVKPYGIGGTQSSGAYNEQRLAGSDFVIMQYGTNDRHTNVTPDNTTYNLIDAVQKIKDNIGAETILMCACPASYKYEYGDDVVRYFHMWDVKNAVAKAARHFGMPYVDNYDAFLRYAETHNLTIDDLLADGLHPNDLGYKVMFENIMRTLGLPLIPEY